MVKEGNKKVADKASSGTPSTAITYVSIKRVHEFLMQARRLTLWEFSSSLKVSLEKIKHTLYQ
jgi:hypothetical protein